MGLEPQIEAWSAHGLLSRKIHLSQNELALGLNKQQTVLKSVESHRFLTGSGTALLILNIGDSDVRTIDTEAGEGVLLTSPFIEGRGRCALDIPLHRRTP